MASFVAMACDGDLTSTSEVSGRVAIAISSQVLRATPVDSIELQVLQGASLQVYAKKLTSADTIVPFTIKVRSGTVRFTAQVLSNTGFLLYSGDTTQTIRHDVHITLGITPQNPILSVSPESLRVTRADTVKFMVSNKGTGSTSWQRDSSPPVGPCPSKGRLVVFPDTGTVAPSEVDTAKVNRSSGGDLNTILCTVRFRAISGYVDVRVTAAP